MRRDNVDKKQIHAMMVNTITQIRQNRGPKFKDKRNFSQRIKEACKAMADLTGQSFDLSTQNLQWAKLQAAARVRDRLTHPKAATDTIVTDSEMLMVADSTAWFNDTFSMLISRPCVNDPA